MTVDLPGADTYCRPNRARELRRKAERLAAWMPLVACLCRDDIVEGLAERIAALQAEAGRLQYEHERLQFRLSRRSASEA